MVNAPHVEDDVEHLFEGLQVPEAKALAAAGRGAGREVQPQRCCLLQRFQG